MINRNEDAILLAGRSDETLAKKVLELAERTIERKGVSESDGSVGAVLHRVVPYLADKFGIDVGKERSSFENAGGDYPADMEELRVKDMAKEVMVASLYSKRPEFSGNPIFENPEKGNVVATLLERYMEKIEMPMAVGPKGETIEPDWTPSRTQSGYTGPDAKGTTVIAEYMLEKTAQMGHHAVPYWAPGHTEKPREYEPGSVSERFARNLTPETKLGHLNEKAYAKRLYELPTTELAAEMLEQARETRERHDLKLDERSGYQRYMTWHGIPMMAELAGGGQMTTEERSDFVREEENRQRHAKDRREEYVPLSDQKMFNSMSSAVINGFAEGSRYILYNDKGIKPTLAEHVMFNEPVHGNSMIMLLDRVADKFGVQRGEEYDLAGRAIAERTDRNQSDYAWKPKEPEAAKPAVSMDQQAMMARQAQGMGF